METASSAAATRGGSLQNPSPNPKEWRAASDSHIVGDASDYVNGMEPDGFSNGEPLQQQILNVCRKKGELQQLEIELRTQMVARQIESNFESQLTEYANTAARMQEQLREKERSIREAERKLEEKDRELHAIKLDKAAWAKEGILREQNKEVATFRREPGGRNKWTPTDDVVLISAWLNTSKDRPVGNEQKSGAFWKRIAAYVAASPKVAGREYRESNHCKNRWQKIHHLVSKFCGAYDAATREKSSGQNESDVLKLAHEIFYNDNQKKFNLEHAWKELRNDQKWYEFSACKTDGSSKKRKCEDGSQSSTSPAFSNVDDQATNRPPGVKAAKGGGKRTTVEGKAMSENQSMWAIKEKDLAMKERLSKMGLLDSLIAKKEPLSEYEEALKTKLITDMLSN